MKKAVAEPLTADEIDQLAAHLDDETEWVTIDEFWAVWSPRLNDRLRRLIATAKQQTTK